MSVQEETEMKTLESIREEIWEEMLRLEDKRKDQWADIKYQTLREVLQKLGHLDELEVLSQEWIDEHKYFAEEKIGEDAVVKARDLRNLLVPKQEITYEDALKVIAENIDTDEFSIGLYLEALSNNEKYEFLTEKWIEDNTSPVDEEGRLYVWKRDLQNVIVPKESLGISQKLEKVQIPKFVADWIEEMKQDERPLYSVMSSLMNKTNHEWAVWKSANKNFSEVVAQTWLDGYTVEEEQKYYVLSKDRKTILLERWASGISPCAMPISEKEEGDMLTEQEIKDYDERYWAFAVKVEELEE